ncbi:MAG TPA: M23 family metallopeptidase [Candidatus Limnocylindrales bacterium]|nr:M23 family metallopeptidase [Candidatus Limnocylindrales bacterium]
MLATVVAMVALACAPSGRPNTPDPVVLTLPADPLIRAIPSEPLTCTDRVGIPEIANAFDARWSEDSNTIAVSRIVTIANSRTITGSEEDQRISILDLASGTVRDLGKGSKPAVSATGQYVAYWREGDDDLRIVRGNRLIGLAAATQPDVKWVGDELYFFHNGEIRVWKDGATWTVANVLPDLEPRYPKDDVYFSADAQRFTMTRYYTDGNADRYIGTTSTGVMDRLPDDGTLYLEWSPVGHTLLSRSLTSATLRTEKDVVATPLASLPGPVHGWTGDGRLFFGRMSPTMPSQSSFDKFAVLGDASEVAAIPNLLGVRAFSRDGHFFMGVTRTGLYSTQLEVYRCGAVADPQSDPRADTAARARTATIAADPRHFVRPVSGAIAQYVQGIHTGIDVAAPVGAILVASDDGIVSAVGWVPVGGRRVCVQHGGGLESCDYHTSAPLVAIGDHVARGQPVALVGMTGMTFGPHVHWEAKLNGMVVDPLQQ